MEAFAVHDQLGNILSISFVDLPEGLSGGRLAPAGHIVTRIRAPRNVKPEDSAALEALVRDYRVDVAKGELTRAKA
jgi:hypothetical protein